MGRLLLDSSLNICSPDVQIVGIASRCSKMKGWVNIIRPTFEWLNNEATITGETGSSTNCFTLAPAP